jgi:hypothetical protein
MQDVLREQEGYTAGMVASGGQWTALGEESGCENKVDADGAEKPHYWMAAEQGGALGRLVFKAWFDSSGVCTGCYDSISFEASELDQDFEPLLIYKPAKRVTMKTLLEVKQTGKDTDEYLIVAPILFSMERDGTSRIALSSVEINAPGKRDLPGLQRFAAARVPASSLSEVEVVHRFVLLDSKICDGRHKDSIPEGWFEAPAEHGAGNRGCLSATETFDQNTSKELDAGQATMKAVLGEAGLLRQVHYALCIIHYTYTMHHTLYIHYASYTIHTLCIIHYTYTMHYSLYIHYASFIIHSPCRRASQTGSMHVD